MASSTHSNSIKSVAVIGAGAAGAVATAALDAEDYFNIIRVFERRECAGGTWIYDPDPGVLPIHPGAFPPETDPPLPIPDGSFPRTLPRCSNGQPRYDRTPIYEELTTNVPDIAMSFTDRSFPYGPFTPHWIPKQYIENYFSWHRTDRLLFLNTTVEDITLIDRENGRWRLTLRKPDPRGKQESWWQEEFDAVVIANGHYSVPFVPDVTNLKAYMAKFPGRVQHSKTYRSPRNYANRRVLIIGNSASGHDVMTQLRLSKLCKGPIYVSRRSRSRWDLDEPPEGVTWKPIITEYDPKTGDISFADGTKLKSIDRVIYCTGYKASFPFWNAEKNGGPLYDYENDRIVRNYQHTFLSDFPTLALVGMPRVLTFRSFEYQSIAIARLWAKRATRLLPSFSEQESWLSRRAGFTKSVGRRFHQIEWECGETMDWFRFLFELAGLPALEGIGRCPPVLDAKTRWAIDTIKKYPDRKKPNEADSLEEDGWEVLEASQKDTLSFI